MNHTAAASRIVRAMRRAALPLGIACAMAAAAGCSDSKPKRKDPLASKYPTLPAKIVPGFLKGTLLEKCNLENNTPYPVSGYGLVVGLDRTGDSRGLPLAVRQYIMDEMTRHGFGSTDDRMRGFTPEGVMADRRAAVVEVFGLLPPGARKEQRIDLFVQAATGTQTTSLAGGWLYQCDLHAGYVDSLDPKGPVTTYGKARGPVFVNPGLAIGSGARPNAALRSGTIMNGGMVIEDRPLILRLLTPQLSMAQSFQNRINQRFDDVGVGIAKDDGIVYAIVPRHFNGDWEHFAGVVTHLYLSDSPDTVVRMSRELAAEAVKPDALLKDISFCWEGLGEVVLPYIQPLYVNASHDVAFAAARAGAFIGDPGAEQVLAGIATTDGNPFQVNAVKVLGALQPSPHLNRLLAGLLASKDPLVRIHAYGYLSGRNCPDIISKKVGESFILDYINTPGTPLVYATRTGIPRVAVFGQNVRLNMPIMFSAMDERLTLSTPMDGRGVLLFDRTRNNTAGVQVRVRPEIPELVHTLGGGADSGIRFGYAEVVGILQALSQGGHLSARFVLQDLPGLREAIENAPPLPETANAPALPPPDLKDPLVPGSHP